MVLDYYKLDEQPFGVTPDSRYLFLAPSHKEALNSLIYGIESGCGFVALVATPGLGKTTLLFETLHILRDKARIVFLFQTIATPLDLLRSLLSGLGVRDIQGSLVEMQIRLRDLLNEHYSQGKRVVLVIDEAQNLDDSVLELVRILSNFETARDKLIQIVLAGQPQLAENIGSPELLQLRQRISIFARLSPFTPEETSLYIAHRLRIAGYRSDEPLFTNDAMALIALCSEGIPRNINNLCFNALALGCALQQKPVDRDIVRQVIADLDLGKWRNRASLLPRPEDKAERVSIFSSATAAETPSRFAGWPWKAGIAAVVLFAAGAVLLAGGWLGRRSTAPQSAATVVANPAPVTSGHPATAAKEIPDTAAQAGPLPNPDPDLVPRQPPSVVVPAASSPLMANQPSMANQPPQPVDTPGTVHVTEGQTLLGICVEKFGSCTAELLQQIHQLNPWLNNPDHIETGQDIRIPVLDAQSRAGEQPRKALSPEAGTHE
jgi:type II secretory pathway predicted ATPase ExeA